MADEKSPEAHRVIGIVALVLGALLLAFSVAMLANGKDSGRTEYSGLVVSIVFLVIGAFEVARSRRGGP